MKSQQPYDIRQLTRLRTGRQECQSLKSRNTQKPRRTELKDFAEKVRARIIAGTKRKPDLKEE